MFTILLLTMLTLHLWTLFISQTTTTSIKTKAIANIFAMATATLMALATTSAAFMDTLQTHLICILRIRFIDNTSPFFPSTAAANSNDKQILTANDALTIIKSTLESGYNTSSTSSECGDTLLPTTAAANNTKSCCPRRRRYRRRQPHGAVALPVVTMLSGTGGYNCAVM